MRMPHTKNLTNNSPAVSVQLIERRIYLIRGHKVMIDTDLAELYGVPTKRLNERVRRNSKRFPDDFMFQLTKAEAESLRSQFATSKVGRGGRHITLCLHRARRRNVSSISEYGRHSSTL